MTGERFATQGDRLLGRRGPPSPARQWSSTPSSGLCAWGALSSSLSRPRSQPREEPLPLAAPRLIRLSDYIRSWN